MFYFRCAFRLLLAGRQVYPAVDYHPDEAACFSSTVAYLMSRIGAPEDWWSPGAIDAITGRERGEPTHNSQAEILALLEQGANVTTISAYDRALFVEHGLDYLAAYCSRYSHSSGSYIQTDPDLFFTRWTPALINTHRRYEAALLEGVKRYPDQYRWEQRTASVEDMLLHVRLGHAVLLDTVSTRGEGIVHHRVAVGHDPQEELAAEELICFDNEHDPPFVRLGLQWFWKEDAYTDDGLIVVW